MRAPKRTTSLAVAVMASAGLVALVSTQGSATPTVTLDADAGTGQAWDPAQLLVDQLSPDTELLDDTSLVEESGTQIRTRKYLDPVLGVPIDLSTITPPDNSAGIDEILADRPLTAAHTTITLAGREAILERTADEYGPGLLIVTFAHDQVGIHLVTSDTVEQTTFLAIAEALA